MNELLNAFCTALPTAWHFLIPAALGITAIAGGFLSFAINLCWYFLNRTSVPLVNIYPEVDDCLDFLLCLSVLTGVLMGIFTAFHLTPYSWMFWGASVLVAAFTLRGVFDLSKAAISLNSKLDGHMENKEAHSGKPEVKDDNHDELMRNLKPGSVMYTPDENKRKKRIEYYMMQYNCSWGEAVYHIDRRDAVWSAGHR